MAKKYILISLIIDGKMTKNYGRTLLSFFYNNYLNLAPQFANFYEPVNKIVSSVEEAIMFWEDQEFLCRRKTKVKGYWGIGTDRSEIAYHHFNYTWNKSIDWYNLLQDLIKLSKAYFGYVHVFTDNEIIGAYLGSPASVFQHGPASFHLKKGIPQLGWGNYFGEEYVKEIDVDLLKKNGFEIKPLGEGYVFNVTPQLSDVINNYEEFDARRTLLKTLFRPGLFQKYSHIDEDADQHPLMQYVRKLESERDNDS